MKGKRTIHSIKLKNILSFGGEGQEIELQPLNVLIGPNGSGKSNLIEAIGLLRSAPAELTVPVREGGGVRDWLWKGADQPVTAGLEAVVRYPDGSQPLRYRLAFAEAGGRFEVTNERVENAQADPGHDKPYFY
ncbi:MAG: AAA family ATPase, partial [Blastocatellia bacterium]